MNSKNIVAGLLVIGGIILGLQGEHIAILVILLGFMLASDDGD